MKLVEKRELHESLQAVNLILIASVAICFSFQMQFSLQKETGKLSSFPQGPRYFYGSATQKRDCVCLSRLKMSVPSISRFVYFLSIQLRI